MTFFTVILARILLLYVSMMTKLSTLICLRFLNSILLSMVLSTAVSAHELKWPFTNYWDGNLKGILDVREKIAVKKFSEIEILNFISTFHKVPENSVFLQELKFYLQYDLKQRSQKDFLISARLHGFLDDPAFATLYNDLKNAGKKKHIKLMNLPNYEQALKALRKKYQENSGKLPEEQTVFDFKWKEFFLKVNGVYLSPRAKLYNQYNTYQIKQLAKLMDDTMKTMSAEKISINVDYDGNGTAERTYELPIPEKYRMALRLLNLEKQRLVQEGMLSAPPQNLDLLTAAFESGLIDGELLNELVNMKELKVKNFDRYKVYKQMLVRIGKAAVTAIPVAGPILIIPIVIIESYIDIRKNNNVSDASHIF